MPRFTGSSRTDWRACWKAPEGAIWITGRDPRKGSPAGAGTQAWRAWPLHRALVTDEAFAPPDSPGRSPFTRAGSSPIGRCPHHRAPEARCTGTCYFLGRVNRLREGLHRATAPRQHGGRLLPRSSGAVSGSTHTLVTSVVAPTARRRRPGAGRRARELGQDKKPA